MRLIICAGLLMLSATANAQDGSDSVTADDGAITLETQTAEEWITAFEEKLDRRTGEIRIADDTVVLNVPDGFYYLDTEDANAVLTEAWGNPVDELTLGMLFPAKYSPLDKESWGVNLSYSDDGYVSDKEAAKIDYDQLMRDMQSEATAENAWREENGYPSIEILGWAEDPSYDPDTNKMVWAKRIQFAGSDVETLNYNVRALGRQGVFNANFIANGDQLAEVKDGAPDVMAMIEFTDGNRYADYKKGDRVAAYGLAGLIAGGAIAKKTGLIAIVLLAAKKFGVIILAGIAGLFGAVRRMFGGKPKA